MLYDMFEKLIKLSPSITGLVTDAADIPLVADAVHCSSCLVAVSDISDSSIKAGLLPEATMWLPSRDRTIHGQDQLNCLLVI